jgi:hypothetical protein
MVLTPFTRIEARTKSTDANLTNAADGTPTHSQFGNVPRGLAPLSGPGNRPADDRCQRDTADQRRGDAGVLIQPNEHKTATRSERVAMTTRSLIP